MRKLLPVIICAISLSLFCVSPLWASQPVSIDDRIQAINNSMNCLSSTEVQESNLTWEDVCYTSSSVKRMNKVSEALDTVEYLNKKKTKRSNHKYSTRHQAREPRSYKPVSRPLNPIKNRPPESKNFSKYAQYTEPLPKGVQLSNSINDEEYDNWFWHMIDNAEIKFKTELMFISHEGEDFFKTEGFMRGINGILDYTIVENKRVKSIADVFGSGNRINTFRIDVLWANGNVDYDSKGDNDFTRGIASIGRGGKVDDFGSSIFDARGIVGYDIPLDDSLKITPYSGIGYRTHRERFNENGFTSTGQITYPKKKRLLYMPFGFDVEKKMAKTWDMKFNFEVDLILDGEHENNFHEGGFTLTGTNFGTNNIDAIELNQKGYGLRGSVELTKETKWFNLVVEPFFRYWRFKESSPKQISARGGSILYYFDPAFTDAIVYSEPKNTTLEWGLKIGSFF